MTSLATPAPRAPVRTPPRTAAPYGRPAHAARREPPSVLTLRRCACGGNCPRCRGSVAQPRLAINTPGDRFEREADAAAEAVMSARSAPVSSSSSSPSLRRCACGGSCPSCRKEQDEAELHREDAGAGSAPGFAPPVVHEVLASPGRPLGGATRGLMERRFGADFSGVRVHDDARSAESARAVDAHAYAVGSDLVFGAGRYAPGTPAGDRLLAHELAHTLQQGGVARRLQRACGPAAIGAPAGCTVSPSDYGVWVPGSPFRFNGGCDDFSSGQSAALTAYVAGLPANTTLEIHGFASVDGDASFNHNLACARALAAQALLTGGGISPSRITGVFNHGATTGPTADRRSVVIRVATVHHFRVAAASFLSCAQCNPFTDDGLLGVTPPTAEPTPGSSFRQKHHIEAELVTLDGRTISRAGLLGAGNDIGMSGFCGTTRRAHVVSFAPAGAARRLTSVAHGEGIEFQSELFSRVQAFLPATFPGSPCGLTGTNPMIPVIGNIVRLRLFADGTKESEFAGASLYPSHFLYEDGTLKTFGGAPVHPHIDFFAWSTSTGVPLSATILGFKALRSACCSPGMSAAFCSALCLAGTTVPSPAFSPTLCGIHAARLAAASCPAPCAPAGAGCTPLVLPSNP